MGDNTEYYLNTHAHYYMDEVASRIIAKSGIPSDRYHLGKVLLQCMRDDPEFVMQIDGSTGERETNGSALERCIRCANSLTQRGVSRGDVVVLMAPNHLHLAVPFYAALFLGVSIAPVDRLLGVHELKDAFAILRPKVVFCQKEKVSDCKHASKMINLDSEIISFDQSDKTVSFAKFLSDSAKNIDVDGFKATDFDPDETTALLAPTTGTTDLPKFCVLTHKTCLLSIPTSFSLYTKFPSPVASAMVVSPLQWMSAIHMYLIGVCLKITRIQSPLAMTSEHTIDIIKKFQPAFMIISPTMMVSVVKVAGTMDCDFSSFDLLYFGGSAVPKELVQEVKRMSPRTLIVDVYGMTEIAGMGLIGLNSPLGSSGKRIGHLQYRLVNPDTGEDIKEPNVTGELWMKSPGTFKGYYGNPKASAEALSEDGWLKSGDLMYRDENWNFFFVERIKLLLKYKNHQISPLEIESVIRQHPDVLDVAVSGVPHQFGDLPVACVVVRPGRNIAAEDINNLVKERLTDTKQLRGGVIFLSELPLTTSTKLHRRKLKKIVIDHVKARGIDFSNII